jgi:exopolyphosphatase/guanosine-5'-triphosphate,3'-diphosphate pyrophosphatase
MRRLAAIDVGSNALRLRIVEHDTHADEWAEVTSVRAAVRLGHDVFAQGELSAETLDRAARALGEFRELMDREDVHAYRAVATSATREAANGSAFVARARREGIALETIDGLEEARLVQLGVSRRVAFEGRTALVDIGGGSTEVTVLDGRRTVVRASLPLGTVRLLAAWHPEGGAVSKKRLGVLQQVVERSLAELAPELASVDQVVATGGSVRAISKLCGRAAIIGVAKMSGFVERLRVLSEVERARAFELRADRADTILPAAIVLGGVASAADARTITAPDAGIRDGILAELAAPRPASRPRLARVSLEA